MINFKWFLKQRRPDKFSVAIQIPDTILDAILNTIGILNICNPDLFSPFKSKTCPFFRDVMQGQDSPSFKIYYLSLGLSLFQRKTLQVEKTVIVELVESQPRVLAES